MRPSGFLRPCALLIAIVMLAAGCGGGGSGNAGSPVSTPGSTVPGVTKDTIRIGNWAPFTGAAASWGAIGRGVDSYFRYVNEQGGIHGRKIKLVQEDDAYQPSRTVPIVKRMVEQDKVFAMVGGVGTSSNLAVIDYLVEKGVPYVGPSTGSSKWANPLKKNVFAIWPNYTVDGTIVGKYVVEKAGAKKVGIFYQNEEAGKELTKASEAAVKAAGGVVSVLVPFELNEVDFSSHALKLKEAGVDTVLLMSVPKPTAALVNAATNIGFKPLWAGSSIINDISMFQLAGQAWTGAVLSSWLPAPNDPEPKVKRYVDAFKKAFPNERPDYFGLIGWAEAEVLAEGLRRAGPNLTRESFMTAMETIKDWNDGVANNVTFSPTQHQGQTSMHMVEAAASGEYKKISDWFSAK